MQDQCHAYNRIHRRTKKKKIILGKSLTSVSFDFKANQGKEEKTEYRRKFL